MFAGAAGFSGDLSPWATASVTSLRGAFTGAGITFCSQLALTRSWKTPQLIQTYPQWQSVVCTGFNLTCDLAYGEGKTTDPVSKIETCEVCSGAKQQYTLSSDVPCKPCPSGADCTFGGASVVPRSGYARGEPYFKTCVSNSTRLDMQRSVATGENQYVEGLTFHRPSGPTESACEGFLVTSGAAAFAFAPAQEMATINRCVHGEAACPNAGGAMECGEGYRGLWYDLPPRPRGPTGLLRRRPSPFQKMFARPKAISYGRCGLCAEGFTVHINGACVDCSSGADALTRIAVACSGLVLVLFTVYAGALRPLFVDAEQRALNSILGPPLAVIMRSSILHRLIDAARRLQAKITNQGSRSSVLDIVQAIVSFMQVLAQLSVLDFPWPDAYHR